MYFFNTLQFSFLILLAVTHSFDRGLIKQKLVAIQKALANTFVLYINNITAICNATELSLLNTISHI